LDDHQSGSERKGGELPTGREDGCGQAQCKVLTLIQYDTIFVVAILIYLPSSRCFPQRSRLWRKN